MLENFEGGISGHSGYYLPDPTDDNYESRYRLGVDLNFSGDPFTVQLQVVL